MNEIRR